MPPNVDIHPFSLHGIHAEWVKTSQAGDQTTILYLHGGGYTMGSCITHRSMVARISLASRASALLIDYRLAPEHPYPAALDDVVKAYGTLLEQGMPPGKIVIAGDSAGGNLAFALPVFLRDQREPLPAAIVSISPWADLTLTGETMTSCAQSDPLLSTQTSALHADWYLGDHDPRSPLVSTVFADLSGLPPALIQAGEYEILRSDAERLAANAKRDGVEVSLEIWPGMWHVWHAMAGVIPESQRAVDRIGAFIQEHTGVGRQS